MKSRWIQIILVLLLLVISGVAAYRLLENSRALPEGLIQANGRIEGETITVAGKVAGRITALKVREGDAVKAGEVLVLLDDKSARARLDQARAALDAAGAQADASRASLEVLRMEVPLGISSAEAGVKAAQAALEKAQSAEAQARKDAERSRNLVGGGLVSAQLAEKSDLALKHAADELSTARAALTQARQLHEDRLLGPARIRAKEGELNAFEASRSQAAARVREAESALEDLTIASPLDAIVATKIANEGEVVNAGTPLYELVDLDNLYLKVYVAQDEIGKLRRGLSAQVFTDAFPEEPYLAELRTIASQAEFTPKEVQTQRERVKLVYAVKLYFTDNPDHRITPGLPADAVIRWKEEAPWARPRW